MFKRLFLVLLIACLAVPAAAVPSMGQTAPDHAAAAGSCHEQAPPQEPSSHPAPKHQCIGCVPLVSACAAIDGAPELRGVTGLAVLPRRLDSLI